MTYRSRSSSCPSGWRESRRGLAPIVALVAALALSGCIQGTQTPPPETDGDRERGAHLIGVYGCGGCHIIPGIDDANGLAGPPLTHWVERRYIAGALRNEPGELIRWIMDPQAIEPGTAMPTMAITEPEARDIAAYLYTVGDARPLGPPHLIPIEWLRGIGGWAKK